MLAPALSSRRLHAAEAYCLPAIPYLRLTVHDGRRGAGAAAALYKGSTLRGAFGHALRAMSCQLGPNHPCWPCPLRQECAYGRVFEPVIEGEPPLDGEAVGTSRPERPLWELRPGGVGVPGAA